MKKDQMVRLWSFLRDALRKARFAHFFLLLSVALFISAGCGPAPPYESLKQNSSTADKKSDAEQNEATPKKNVGDAEIRCSECGMLTAPSETRSVIGLADGAQQESCSLACLIAISNKNPGYKFMQTTAHDGGILVDVESAVYVIESEIHPEGSMLPFVFAFSKLAPAEEFIKKHKGKIIEWKALLEILRNVASATRNVSPEAPKAWCTT